MQPFGAAFADSLRPPEVETFSGFQKDLLSIMFLIISSQRTPFSPQSLFSRFSTMVTQPTSQRLNNQHFHWDVYCVHNIFAPLTPFLQLRTDQRMLDCESSKWFTHNRSTNARV